MRDKVRIDDENNELIVEGEKYYKIGKYYFMPNDLIKPLFKRLVDNSSRIEKMLYTCPAFIEIVKSTIPIEMYNVVLSGTERAKMAMGSVKMMTTADGKLLANLVNTKSGKIISNIKLDKVSLTPELNNAIINYVQQVQLAQIAENIRYVQLAVEEVRRGQENDRLALAYSCQQKLLQALEIKDENIKRLLLMNLVSSAEDARNALMLSQKENIKFIEEQPQDKFQRFFKGKKPEDIDSRMNELRESFNSLNMLSLVESLAYQELGEEKASILSINYYGEYLNSTYLKNLDLVKRLDSIDPSPKNYWSKQIPKICKSVDKLIKSEEKENQLLEENNEKEDM